MKEEILNLIIEKLKARKDEIVRPWLDEELTEDQRKQVDLIDSIIDLLR